jgi:hypothetical protein
MRTQRAMPLAWRCDATRLLERALAPDSRPTSAINDVPEDCGKVRPSRAGSIQEDAASRKSTHLPAKQ